MEELTWYTSFDLVRCGAELLDCAWREEHCYSLKLKSWAVSRSEGATVTAKDEVLFFYMAKELSFAIFPPT